ncbi:MAG: phosphatidylglycerophosphatase A [Wenzhouxiangella sp.]|nr:phosphatidylglycerophosphatase A [Wenzhouxiangella sp.]
MSADIGKTREIALSTPTGFLAFGFGSGLSPAAPGTAGSAVALVPAIALAALPTWAGLLIVGLAFAVGCYLCGETSRRLGVHDHGGIVWDEFVGLWLVLLLIPSDPLWWLAGFVLFRLFDILKPWPIRWLDRRVEGGFGIMVDDLLAAVYALVALLLLQMLLP